MEGGQRDSNQQAEAGHDPAESEKDRLAHLLRKRFDTGNNEVEIELDGKSGPQTPLTFESFAMCSSRLRVSARLGR